MNIPTHCILCDLPTAFVDNTIFRCPEGHYKGIMSAESTNDYTFWIMIGNKYFTYDARTKYLDWASVNGDVWTKRSTDFIRDIELDFTNKIVLNKLKTIMSFM